MGYYTNYELVIYPYQNPENEIEIMRVIASKIYDEPMTDISDNEAKWCLVDELKWYDHTEDMVEVSKQFPELTFVLYGEGEDSEDIWCEYFNNGDFEVTHAEIVYPQPNNPKFQSLIV